jgi:hypothetical protein
MPGTGHAEDGSLLTERLLVEELQGTQRDGVSGAGRLSTELVLPIRVSGLSSRERDGRDSGTRPPTIPANRALLFFRQYSSAPAAAIHIRMGLARRQPHDRTARNR